MNDVEFIGYVGSPDFHDGVVLQVSVEGRTAEVVVEGYSGREHVVLFEGVDEVEMNAPEGMLLYSLLKCELHHLGGDSCLRTAKKTIPAS